MNDTQTELLILLRNEVADLRAEVIATRKVVSVLRAEINRSNRRIEALEAASENLTKTDDLHRSGDYYSEKPASLV